MRKKEEAVKKTDKSSKTKNTVNKMDQKWCIGIDFGTSNTYIVAYDKDANMLYSQKLPESLRMGDRGIPTVVAYDIVYKIDEAQTTVDAEDVLIGKQAIEHGSLIHYRNLKQDSRRANPKDKREETKGFNFGTETPFFKLTGEIIANFFKKAFEKMSEGINNYFNFNENTIERIVIGCPCVSKNERYDDVLKEGLCKCFLSNADKSKIKNFNKKIEVLPEPELAGITYLMHSCVADDVILVIDAGGGTTDFSVLWIEGDEDQKKVISKKIEQDRKLHDIGGKNIDEVIKIAVSEKIKGNKGKTELNSDEIPLIEDCRLCKENIFSQTSNPEHKASGEVKGVTVFYKKSGKENTNYIILDNIKSFKEILENLGKRLEEGLKKYFNESFKKINKVLFVGGTSKIYPLRQSFIGVIERLKSENIVADNVVYITPQDKKWQIKIGEGTEKGETVTWFNAVAIGACIKAIGKNPVVLPTIDFKWSNDGEQSWVRIFPKSNIIEQGVLTETFLDFYSMVLPRGRFFRMKDKGLSLELKINNGNIQKINMLRNQGLNGFKKDCILVFSYDRMQVTLTAYDGEEDKKKEWEKKDDVKVQLGGNV